MLSVLKNQPAAPSSVQPPEKLRPHLRDAINDLKRKVLGSQPNPLHRTEGVTACGLYQRDIERWVGSLTPAQRLRRYAIGEVIKLAGVNGCSGKQASVQVMGAALQACGLVQKRDWTKAGRNQRYWKIKEHDDE